MSTFSVNARTESGERHQFDAVARTSAEVHANAAEQFGDLCYVMVKPK